MRALDERDIAREDGGQIDQLGDLPLGQPPQVHVVHRHPSHSPRAALVRIDVVDEVGRRGDDQAGRVAEPAAHEAAGKTGLPRPVLAGE